MLNRPGGEVAARDGVLVVLRARSLHDLDDANGNPGVELVNARRYDLLAGRQAAGNDRPTFRSKR